MSRGLGDVYKRQILDNVDKILGGDLESIEDLEYRKKLRFIPFTSVGKQNGMLLGIKANTVKIVTDVEEIINKRVIVGIYEKTFSKSGRYNGLIGLDILERSEKNEYLTVIKK